MLPLLYVYVIGEYIIDWPDNRFEINLFRVSIFMHNGSIILECKRQQLLFTPNHPQWNKNH